MVPCGYLSHIQKPRLDLKIAAWPRLWCVSIVTAALKSLLTFLINSFGTESHCHFRSVCRDGAAVSASSVWAATFGEGGRLGRRSVAHVLPDVLVHSVGLREKVCISIRYETLMALCGPECAETHLCDGSVLCFRRRFWNTTDKQAHMWRTCSARTGSGVRFLFPHLWLENISSCKWSRPAITRWAARPESDPRRG